MLIETAGKLLSADKDVGLAVGEFWVQDTCYDVYIEELKGYEAVKVDIENLEDFEPRCIGEAYNIKESEYDRSLIGVEEAVGIPETNRSFEAYVLKALKDSKGDFEL